MKPPSIVMLYWLREIADHDPRQPPKRTVDALQDRGLIKRGWAGGIYVTGEGRRVLAESSAPGEQVVGGGEILLV